MATTWNLDPLGNSTVRIPGDIQDPPAEDDELVLSTPSKVVFIQKDILFNASSCDGFNDQDCTTGASATTFGQFFYQEDRSDVPEVPEPATMLLFSTALLGLGFMRRKKS